MAKHTVRIMNYRLTLTSDDDKTYIENIAQRVERNVKALSDAMPTRNMTEVSLFVAMDYCDRYMKSIGDGTNMRGQIKDYLKDSGFARRQLDDAKKEIELLRAENEKLKARLGEAPESEEQPGAQETPAEPEKVQQVSAPDAAAVTVPQRPIPVQPAPEKETLFSRSSINNKKNKKKKENKQAAPIKGEWGADANSESADAAADIMSFFEEKSFMDDDD